MPMVDARIKCGYEYVASQQRKHAPKSIRVMRRYVGSGGMNTVESGSPATATEGEVRGSYDIYTSLACVQEMQKHPRDFEVISVVLAAPDDERGSCADSPTPEMYPLPEVYTPITGYSN